MNKFNSMVGYTLALYLISSTIYAQSVLDMQRGILEPKLDKYLNNRDHLSICDRYDLMPKDLCGAWLEYELKEAFLGNGDKESVKEQVKKLRESPEYFNSIMSKGFGDDMPLGLKFKLLDSEAGESILGLEYSYSHNFEETDRGGENWRNSTVLDFSANGTLTSDSEENPRNFLDTKFTYAWVKYTRVPVQTDSIGKLLTDISVAAAVACQGSDRATPKCVNAKKKVFGVLEEATSTLNWFQSYEFGVDAGYESDQKFEAKQSKLSAFASSQFENWNKRELLFGLDFTPSFRIGLDQINPDDDTPRAKAGDDSSYNRISGEASLWFPIGTYFQRRLAFTANYRHYREVSPSNLVKDAHLDSYNIRTFSLATPDGLFASYSSGRLPLDQQTDEVIELGWKSYF